MRRIPGAREPEGLRKSSRALCPSFPPAPIHSGRADGNGIARIEPSVDLLSRLGLGLHDRPTRTPKKKGPLARALHSLTGLDLSRAPHPVIGVASRVLDLVRSLSSPPSPGPNRA